MTQRKIIHVDMDCFYAAVEMRDDPTLRRKAVAVGGDPNQRGVLCTCNYEARRYGIHSAMPTAHALKLCPDLVVLPVRMDKYVEESRKIRAVFSRFTDLIEPLSLDEAFLDVSQCKQLQGSATRIARAIKDEIKQATGLTASAGVAANKFLAKVASDWEKPDGLTVISPDKVDEFVRQLPVKKIFGVGAKTLERLHAANLYSCEDIQQLSMKQLIDNYGRFGVDLYNLSRGVDHRPVANQRERKSLSVEHTFNVDLLDMSQLMEALDEIFAELLQRLENKTALRKLVKNVYIKIKYADFSLQSAQKTTTRIKREDFADLLAESWHKRPQAVRLLGLGVSFKDKEDWLSRQLSFKFQQDSLLM